SPSEHHETNLRSARTPYVASTADSNPSVVRWAVPPAESRTISGWSAAWALERINSASRFDLQNSFLTEAPNIVSQYTYCLLELISGSLVVCSPIKVSL